MGKWETNMAAIAARIDSRRWEFTCAQDEAANTFVFEGDGGSMIAFPDTWHASAGVGIVAHVCVNFAPTEAAAKQALEAALRVLAEPPPAAKEQG